MIVTEKSKTKEFQELTSSKIKENEPLSSYTSFHIGGPASWYVQIKKEDEIVALTKRAQELGVPVFIMGGGSNILVSDSGFQGLVIHMALERVSFEGARVYAEAGVITATLSAQIICEGLSGFEWAVGIPGRIGGAIRGNAGASGGEMKDVVSKVKYLDVNTLKVKERSNKQCLFAYRESIFKKTNDIILGCWVDLGIGDKQELREKMIEYLNYRNTTQPKKYGSSGCMFKNYEPNDIECGVLLKKGVPSEMIEKKRISAGWLSENSGCKGIRKGDIMVSDVHGNFVVNLGKGTADQVAGVVSQVKARVKERFGIDLEEEVQYIGFN